MKMRRCEDEKMICEDVKMRRCEDEKMIDRPPLLEEPFAQTLSGIKNKKESRERKERRNERKMKENKTKCHVAKFCRSKILSVMLRERNKGE